MGPAPGVQRPAAPAVDVHGVCEPLGQEGASAQDQNSQQDIEDCFHDRIEQGSVAGLEAKQIAYAATRVG